MQHRFLVQLREVIEDSEEVHLVMDYCSLGPVAHLKMADDRGFVHADRVVRPAQRLFSYMGQLLEGLAYLHRRGVVHCDIKPDNLLLFSDDEIRISDFGSCGKLLKGSTTVVAEGTLAFSSPEILSGQNYSKQSDIWALGLSLYVMAFGFLPYRVQSLPMLIKEVANPVVFVPKMAMVEGESFKADEYKALISLLSRMLSKDPRRRPSASELLHDPLLRDYYEPCEKSSSLDFGVTLRPDAQILEKRTMERRSAVMNSEEVREVVRQRLSAMPTRQASYRLDRTA
jgi:serine/threonine protein kinase